MSINADSLPMWSFVEEQGVLEWNKCQLWLSILH